MININRGSPSKKPNCYSMLVNAALLIFVHDDMVQNSMFETKK